MRSSFSVGPVRYVGSHCVPAHTGAPLYSTPSFRCGHCKQLAPVYKKLAKRFSVVDSVVIAKMDGTTNEHPSTPVEGFPSIMFFPAEKDAEPVAFDSSDRSLKVRPREQRATAMGFKQRRMLRRGYASTGGGDCYE